MPFSTTGVHAHFLVMDVEKIHTSLQSITQTSNTLMKLFYTEILPLLFPSSMTIYLNYSVWFFNVLMLVFCWTTSQRIIQSETANETFPAHHKLTNTGFIFCVPNIAKYLASAKTFSIIEVNDNNGGPADYK